VAVVDDSTRPRPESRGRVAENREGVDVVKI
jgi:hypothetical protein